MKISKPVILILLAFLIYSCKKDDNVQVPVNNEPVENGIILTEPANNTIVNIFTPLLKWEQYQNSNSYDVQLSLDANFVTPLLVDSSAGTLEINVPPGRLTTNINYYWRIRASLGGGNFTNWSKVNKFSIILPPPLPPVLVLPQNNSLDQSFLPLFDWDDSPTADFYRLQVSLSSSFSSILLDSNNIFISNLQCPHFFLNTGTNYYWRVNATNSNGVSTGNWSAPFTFRTVEGLTPSSVSGTVTFADNNFVTPPFYYVIGIYRTANWPPINQGYLRIDSLNIKFINNVYSAAYKVENIEDGSYHLAVFTTSRNQGIETTYRSVYGCDTSRVQFSNCAIVSPGTVTITNGNGIENINLLSWADTSKSIF